MKIFTLQEARQLLPLIRELMGRVITSTSRLDTHRETVTALASQAGLNTGSPEGTDYVYALFQIRKYLAEIQETGCEIKNVQEGLVDFPHLREGREVYLCWKYGEDDIQYWHEIDAGFKGRQAL